LLIVPRKHKNLNTDRTLHQSKLYTDYEKKSIQNADEKRSQNERKLTTFKYS